MTKKKLFSFWIFFLIPTVISFNLLAARENKTSTIRVAVLDNFTAEKSSQKYKDDYFAGVTTAITAAKAKGYSIEYKMFSYGRKPLDILHSIPEVKTWNPDLIIGPHSSNQFLLLQRYFKHVLVISPYATDEAIAKMPSNFYSLSLPDRYMAKATVKFMENFFPGKDVFNITQADCKDCLDMTMIFSELYKNKYPQAKISDSYYTGNNVKSINLEKLLANYSPGSVVVLQPLSYSDANTLMQNISNFLKQDSTIFVYNLDNWGNATDARKCASNNNYSCFRVSPLMRDLKSKNFRDFVVYFQKMFGSLPKNAVTYMSYTSIMSAVNALVRFPPNKLDNMEKAILTSFLSAREKDQNWYRPKSFVAYQLDTQGEKDKGVVITF